MLMVSLFVDGAVNLRWIATIALLVLLEKTIPWGEEMMSRATGVGLVALGIAGAMRMI